MRWHRSSRRPTGSAVGKNQRFHGSILFLLLAKCTEVFGEKNSTVILASIYIMDIPLNVIVGAVSEAILGGDPQVTFKLIPNSYENRHFS